MGGLSLFVVVVLFFFTVQLDLLLLLLLLMCGCKYRSIETNHETANVTELCLFSLYFLRLSSAIDVNGDATLVCLWYLKIDYTIFRRLFALFLYGRSRVK